MTTCRLANSPSRSVISVISQLVEMCGLLWIALLVLHTSCKYLEYCRLQTELQELSLSAFTAVHVIKCPRDESYPSVPKKLHADQQWDREESCQERMDTFCRWQKPRNAVNHGGALFLEEKRRFTTSSDGFIPDKSSCDTSLGMRGKRDLLSFTHQHCSRAGGCICRTNPFHQFQWLGVRRSLLLKPF